MTNERSIRIGLQVAQVFVGDQLVQARCACPAACRRPCSLPTARPAGRPPGPSPSRRCPGACVSGRYEQAHVHERDQAEERDQHGGDVQGAGGGRHGSRGRRRRARWHRSMPSAVLTVPSVSGFLGLGHQQLRQQDRAGRGHDHRRQDMPRLDSERDVRGHHAPRDVSHARRHDRQQLRSSEPGQIGADRERRLGLAQEERGRHVRATRPRWCPSPGHHNGETAHDPLHHTQVIEHGEQGRDEDDRGQDAKRKDKCRRARRIDKRFAEDEARRPRARNRGLSCTAFPARRSDLDAGGHAQDQQARIPTARPAPRRPPGARSRGGCRKGRRRPPGSPACRRTPGDGRRMSSRSIDSGTSKSRDQGPSEIR